MLDLARLRQDNPRLRQAGGKVTDIGEQPVIHRATPPVDALAAVNPPDGHHYSCDFVVRVLVDDIEVDVIEVPLSKLEVGLANSHQPSPSAYLSTDAPYTAPPP